MNELLLKTAVSVHGAPRRLAVRFADERGEGVISAAIAVLIIAFLGAAMWLFFDNLWGSTSANISDQVGEIGTPSGGGG